MPFDFPADPTVLAPPETLEGLSFILRHKELWPKNFVWDYQDCNHCALGLAYKLFKHFYCPTHMAAAAVFKMTTEEALDIFIRAGVNRRSVGDFKLKVTPEYIADLIDKYLENKA